jgi:hypothetical protein
MDALKLNYRSTLSDRQAMAIFDKEKPSHRGYKFHLNGIKIGRRNNTNHGIDRATSG